MTGRSAGRAKLVTMKPTRIKLAWMPLDLGDHSPGFLPTLRLIAEAGVVTANLMRRSPDRALEQVTNLFLKTRLAGSRIA
jgi:hypothetical protein